MSELVPKSILAIMNAQCPTCHAKRGQLCVEYGKIVSQIDSVNIGRFTVHADRPDPAAKFVKLRAAKTVSTVKKEVPRVP